MSMSSTTQNFNAIVIIYIYIYLFCLWINMFSEVVQYSQSTIVPRKGIAQDPVQQFRQI
ncbi:hypothetical protein BDV37DRAFT_265022 [Aspergillus pseudonomiae]|uniref:Uncharacterized protein n=1 Tax=Aspergillus pseudonomiae TaxID=1506151 RepID=A0A5N7CVJ3_9EURO|nr:uncharacterized protein BDV37DRAFT_265022 [Aspergillus pseudonomiae]KAE8397747.1 hypothetical protein BDV37DRAFT_265022 [Aspergillus pseudonomiae]